MYLHPRTYRVFVAKDSELKFKNVTIGEQVGGATGFASEVAVFDTLEFKDGPGVPLNEVSELQWEWDLNLVSLSRNNIMGLPFQWFVQNGRLDFRASLQPGYPKSLPLDTEQYLPAWRAGWTGDQVIPGGNIPLDTHYAVGFPAPLRYVLYPLPDPDEP